MLHLTENFAVLYAKCGNLSLSLLAKSSALEYNNGIKLLHVFAVIQTEVFMLAAASIRFVHLGIDIEHLGKNFTIFGFEIAYYGLIIAFGMLAAMLLVFYEAKKTGQNVENYYDYAIWLIVFSVIGARLYYVAFEWEQYKNNLLDIFKTRNGGMAIYGGVLAGILTTIIYAKVKKLNFWQMADTTILGLLLGQIIGRWGNFFNREAFGGFTDNLFAMQIKLEEVGGVISDSVRNHIQTVDGVEYIQVHPTFLYESLWNLILLVLILIFKKYKKFHGEMFAWYVIGYGVGRFMIEGLRTDQLIAPVVNVPVSQIVSVLLVIIGIGIVTAGRKGYIGKKERGSNGNCD